MRVDKVKIRNQKLRRIIRKAIMEQRSFESTYYKDHPHYRSGYDDAMKGLSPIENPSEEYQAGYDSAMKPW